MSPFDLCARVCGGERIRAPCQISSRQILNFKNKVYYDLFKKQRYLRSLGIGCECVFIEEIDLAESTTKIDLFKLNEGTLAWCFYIFVISVGSHLAL